jgi:hypothetical protein
MQRAAKIPSGTAFMLADNLFQKLTPLNEIIL